MRKGIAGISAFMVLMAGCAAASTPMASPLVGQAASLTVSSSAFKAIPVKFTCDGQKVSVPLAWGDAPAATKSYALIVDDPDAPGRVFVHWVLFNIPPTARALPEGVKADAALADGSRNGNNGANQLGYTGPCPPSGVHHYFFKVYALDTLLTLNAGATKDQVLAAMQGHILAQGELMGTYNRNK
jgi:Raf kinase inhibitor-like YbhB/YbcL family protein